MNREKKGHLRQRNWLNCYPVVVWLFAFIFCFAKNNTKFWYDAWYYWELANSFYVDGAFSLSAFPESIRGYFLPMVLSIVSHLGGRVSYWGYWALYSALLTFIICYVTPTVMRVACNTARYRIGCLVMLGLFLYFWGELLIQPLSDLPALALYGVVLYCACKMSTGGYSIRVMFLTGFIAGICTYGAYNMRTVYMYPLLFVWIVFMCKIMIERKKKSICFVLLALVGVVVCAIPQMIINERLYNILSPFVIAEPDGNNNLFIIQLRTGISVPRYETFVGDAAEYPNPGVYFENVLGKELAARASIGTILDFVIWALSNFWSVLGLYMEHVLSAITIFWRKAYLTTISVDLAAFLINALLFITGCSGLCLADKRNWKQAIDWGTLCAFLLPALLALPGALEVRFVLSLYMMLYGYLALKLDYVSLVYKIKEKPYWCIFSLIALFVLCLFANQLLAEVQEGVLTLDGHYFPQ